MIKAELPANEQVRLNRLKQLEILDTPPDESIDAITSLVSEILRCPISLVSLVDEERQWFKSATGLGGVCETGRDIAFCAHAILQPDELLEVPDATRDPRFADNPLVVGPPHIRFYAGVPLVLDDDIAIGTLCVIDTAARTLDEGERRWLKHFAQVVVHLVESRRYQSNSARLGHLAAAANEEVFVVDPSTLTVTYANAAAAAGAQRSTGELIGASFLSVQPDAPVDDFRTLVAGDAPASLAAYSATHRRADGDGYAVRVAVQRSDVEASPALLIVARSIQAELDASEALRKQEANYRALYNRTPVMLHSIDTDGRIVSVSEFWLSYLGYDRDEVIGRRSTDFLTEESRAFATSEVLPKFMATGECWRVPYRMVKKSGEVIDVELSAVANYDEQGEFLTSSAAVVDVTDRNRALADLEAAKEQLESKVERRTKELVRTNEELLEQVRARENLQSALMQASRLAGQAEIATGILHNVGNVLNSLNVSASVLREGLRSLPIAGLRNLDGLLPQGREALAEFFRADSRAEKTRSYLSKLAEHCGDEQRRLAEEMSSIEDNIEHVREVIAQQQQYAKRVGVEEPLDLAELADEVIDMSIVGRHGIKVEKDYAETPVVTGDKHKVLQILLNLVSNAKDAVRDLERNERRISVSIAPHGDAVRIAVSDNGPGIADEHRDRIFSFGYTTKPNGHGFGLHSSANAAGELGGSLELAAPGPGRGATFVLTVPVARNAADAWPNAARVGGLQGA